MMKNGPAARSRWPRPLDPRRRARLARRPALEMMEPRTMLSTIVVNTLSDPSTETAGVTSLRQAIAQAASTSGDQTITFASYLSGPVELAQGPLVLADSSGSLTIQATSGVTTIDAGGASQVLDVYSETTATLDGLTITGGSAYNGGGIDNSGTLTLSGCTVSGNTATNDGGGVYVAFSNSSTLTLTGCTINGNSAGNSGGGIVIDRAATLMGCTISGDSAGGSGGGISSNGTTTLTGCTISGDSAGDSGGGIVSNGTTTLTDTTVSDNTANGSGGGLSAENGTTSLIDSTVYGNTAAGYGGGLYSEFATLSLTFVTVAGNGAQAAGSGVGSGGGVFTQYEQKTQLLDSIVSTNTGGGGAADNLGGLAPVNSGGNLIGSGVVSLDPADNLVNVDDPMLGPLQDNGGSTLTMAPLPGSPAIDAGVFLLSMPATDQVGNPRVQGPTPDVGAIEITEATPAPEAQGLVVTTLSDSIDPYDDQTSLREALDYAATLPGDQSITFAPGLLGTIDLAP